MAYELSKLPYAYNSLEPEIDEKTMLIHHSKHHQGYVDKLNKVLEGHEEIQDKPINNLIRDIESVSEDIRTAVRNNGGGHLNHSFFWEILGKGTNPDGEFLQEINKKFRSFENFKEEFTNFAMSVFGSGWTWLVLNNNELEIINTTGHANPISQGMIPLLVIDVWEHAYYLNYQNKRDEYIKVFFNVINWDKVKENFLRGKR